MFLPPLLKNWKSTERVNIKCLYVPLCKKTYSLLSYYKNYFILMYTIY